MILKLKLMGALCHTDVFKINGVEADQDHFGRLSDIEPELAEDYGCGNMMFIPDPPRPWVLEHYGINKVEYMEVAGKLEELLSFGQCGWCC